MSVLAYHPQTKASLVLDDEQLVHLRASGWMTQAEHDSNEAEAQAAADKAKQADSKPAAKTGEK